MRRPDGNPAPLLVLQHAVGSFGRELCISYELDPEQLVCRHDTPVQEPLVVGDLNGSVAGVPPDEVITSERRRTTMEIFGFAPVFPLDWTASTRPVPAAWSRPRSETSTATPTSTWSSGSRSTAWPPG